MDTAAGCCCADSPHGGTCCSCSRAAYPAGPWPRRCRTAGSSRPCAAPHLRTAPSSPAPGGYLCGVSGRGEQRDAGVTAEGGEEQRGICRLFDARPATDGARLHLSSSRRVMLTSDADVEENTGVLWVSERHHFRWRVRIVKKQILTGADHGKPREEKQQWKR